MVISRNFIAVPLWKSGCYLVVFHFGHSYKKFFVVTPYLMRDLFTISYVRQRCEARKVLNNNILSTAKFNNLLISTLYSTSSTCHPRCCYMNDVLAACRSLILRQQIDYVIGSEWYSRYRPSSECGATSCATSALSRSLIDLSRRGRVVRYSSLLLQRVRFI